MSEKKTESIGEKKVSRRSMLKWTGALAGAAVVGGVAEYAATYKPPPPPPPSFKPPLSADVQAKVDKIVSDLEAIHANDQTMYLNCTANGCFVSCVLKAHLKNGVVTAIEPDDTINANLGREDAYIQPSQINQLMVQYRPCVRGFGFMDDIYAPDIPKYPMKNVGARGPNAKFVRITWDEALDTIAQQMLTGYQKYGPIFMGTGKGTGYSNKCPCGPYIGKGAGFAYWGEDSFPGLEIAEGLTMGVDYDIDPLSPSINELLNAKLIVLDGMDPQLNFYEYVYYMVLARDQGIPIIIFEPTYTWSVESLATQWIPIRPLTDAAMLMAVAYVLFNENLWDQDFVSKHVEPTGFQAWKDYVMGVSGPLKDWITADPTLSLGNVPKTPQWAETICGVPAETITAFARLYANSKPVCFHMHWSTTRGRPGGENNARLGLYLQAMTGNIGIAGSYASVSGLKAMAVDGTTGSFGPVADYGYSPTGAGPNSNPQYKSPTLYNCNTEVTAILLRDDFNSGKLTLAQYNQAIGSVRSNIPPNIHIQGPRGGTDIDGPNFIQNFFDINGRLKAVRMMDFTFGVPYHLNQMQAWYQDIILPAGLKFYYNQEFCSAYALYGNSFLYHPRVANFIGEQRDRIWIMAALAARLGFANNFMTKLQPSLGGFGALTGAALAQWDATMEAVNQQAYETWAATAAIQQVIKETGVQVPSWADFRKNPCLRFPRLHSSIPFADFVQNNSFHTSSKLFEFKSPFISGGTEWTLTNPAPWGMTGRCWGAGHIAPVAEYVMPPTSYIGENVATWPLYVISPHSYYRQHTTQDGNLLFRDEARHSVWISVVDAKARGIKDGDQVHVYNDLGEMILPAYVTSRTLPGVVIIRFGAWYEPSAMKTAKMPDGIDTRGAVNFLIPNDYEGFIIGINYSASLVEVEKFIGLPGGQVTAPT